MRTKPLDDAFCDKLPSVGRAFRKLQKTESGFRELNVEPAFSGQVGRKASERSEQVRCKNGKYYSEVLKSDSGFKSREK
ncbi:hypothetical protein KLQU111869_23365 [Klebsiella quasipneumoniae subsp. similipneumoniae]|nr:hypothetical protein SB00610_00154 [Klebsiella quasipneumoniae subsp. similipneumoniae]